jgi:hypothetical protein
MPPTPIEPDETAEPPAVAIPLPPPAALPPPYGLPPPLGVVVPQAKALSDAQTAKRSVRAPAAATLRPVLITWNTVLQCNAKTIEIR